MTDYARIAIAVESAIAKKSVEFLIKDSGDYHEKYWVAASGILALEAAMIAGEYARNVEIAKKQYNKVLGVGE